MKVVVRLAILVAALLLVTNMAFAECDVEICYSVTATDEYGTTSPDLLRACLSNSGIGTVCGTLGCVNIYLFGGGPGWFNTSGYPGFVNGNPKWATWIAHGTDITAFLQPIGEGYLLTGEEVFLGTRYTIQGIQVPCIEL